VLFSPPAETQVNPGNASISHDGNRVVIAVPPPQLRQVTVFDRAGRIVASVGKPGVYGQPAMSPDGTRVAVMHDDRQTGSLDIWTLELATGKGTAVTSNSSPEFGPIWSPDGRQVGYASFRDNAVGIYTKAADGTGEEELLYRYTPGAGAVPTDWSRDGKFLAFYTGISEPPLGALLLLVPLEREQAAERRQEIEWLRADYDASQGRFSPDGRFIAYLSNEAQPARMELYIREFDPDDPESAATSAPLRVSQNGALGMIAWRDDAQEMYYITYDWAVMAVDIETTPMLRAGAPHRLFELDGPLPGNPAQWNNVSRDGERFVFALPTADGSAP
jgi:Tol biopolymer transport system component